MWKVEGVYVISSLINLCSAFPPPQHLKRTGWVNHGVRDPETVAGHMYRMAMMCFLFGDEKTGSGLTEKPIDRGRFFTPVLFSN